MEQNQKQVLSPKKNCFLLILSALLCTVDVPMIVYQVYPVLHFGSTVHKPGKEIQRMKYCTSNIIKEGDQCPRPPFPRYTFLQCGWCRLLRNIKGSGPVILGTCDSVSGSIATYSLGIFKSSTFGSVEQDGQGRGYPYRPSYFPGI